MSADDQREVRPTCVHAGGYEHPAITKDGGKSWSTCDHTLLSRIAGGGR